MNRVGTIRYLSSREVERLLPPIEDQVELAAEAFTRLGSGDVEMPPKVGVHPGEAQFLHAMPAWIRGSDVLGLKWVAGYPGNAARGLLGVTGLIVMNDPDTGYATCIMDGTLITLLRTVAVTGLAMRLYRPEQVRRVGFVGCGAQACAHLPVILAGLSSVEVLAYDCRTSSAESLVQKARELAGVESARVVDSVPAAVEGADVVLTAVSVRGSDSELIHPDMVGSGTLLLPIDWSQAVTAQTAQAAAWFVVDDRAQFEFVRDRGRADDFAGYPDPHETLAERLARGAAPSVVSAGPMVVSNLGVAAVDVVIANEVLRAAEREDVGTRLEW